MISDDRRPDRPKPAGYKVARANRPTIFACGKCLERMRHGKTMRRALADAVERQSLQDATTAPRKRPSRVVRTACLGLCPKRALVLTSAATLARCEALIVADPGDVPAAVARLLDPIEVGPP